MTSPLNREDQTRRAEKEARAKADPGPLKPADQLRKERRDAKRKYANRLLREARADGKLRPRTKGDTVSRRMTPGEYLAAFGTPMPDQLREPPMD